MTNVRVTRFVDCPFSAVIDFAQEALHGRSDITLSPAPSVRHHVTITAQIADDVSDAVRRHDALLLAWRPALAWLFPDFHGALTVRPKGHGAWIRIQGSYEPPFGVLGRIFDGAIGRYIAQITLARLLADIAGRTESRWHSFRKEIAV